MKTQAIMLEEMLNQKGWRVIFRETNLDWWADELWRIESIWAPHGFTTYITFFIDPQHDGPRKKGQAVWAASTNLMPPCHRSEAEKVVVLRERELPLLIESVSRLRDTAT